jgi:23S rRNA pseudouridine2605 synthase
MLQRLQKIIAQAGIASRRHAEELIRSGQVRVNGEIVTELGSKADPDHDRVEAAGRVAEIPTELVYIILHKPPQVVSTLADPEGRKTLRNFLRGTPERVFPVGRLDYFASGLVLLTSDGQLAARVLRAASRLRQTYWIKVKGRISEEEMREVGRAAQAQFAPLKGPWARRSAENPWYEVELTGPSRDALGRSLARLDHPIEKMNRVQLATLELDPVPEGHYRRLEPSEVEKFSRAVDRVLAEKDAPPIAAPAQTVAPSAAPPPIATPTPAATARPPLPAPVNRPQFAAPRNFSHGAPSKRPPLRPREPWRARNDRPSPGDKSGRAPRFPNDRSPRPPDNRPLGAPAGPRPSRPKDQWRGQKSGPWRGNKSGSASAPRFPNDHSPRPPANRPPGAPSNRPPSRPSDHWREKTTGPWRGNKSGSAGAPRFPNDRSPRPPVNRPPGAPSNRPPSRTNDHWREKKTEPWRGSKPGGAPAGPRPSRPKHNWSEQKNGPWRGGNKS